MAPTLTQCPSPLRHPSPALKPSEKRAKPVMKMLDAPSELKIALCQFDIVFADREANEAKARGMLQHYNKGDFDLLVFPEMSFTGYMFENRTEIEPFLEDERGPTFLFCSELAKKYATYVVAGYPQLDKSTGKCFNSICLVSPYGELLTTYQKTHLYTSDYVWCEEGPGFSSVAVEALGNKRMGFGICMDLNAYQFGDSGRYEFANAQLEQKSDLIIVIANWLDDPNDDYWNASSTHGYWASRLTPLFEQNHKCNVVICNRTGTEKGTTFMGGSCVIDVDQRKLVSALSKREESVLITTVSL